MKAGRLKKGLPTPEFVHLDPLLAVQPVELGHILGPLKVGLVMERLTVEWGIAELRLAQAEVAYFASAQAELHKVRTEPAVAHIEDTAH
jgi:hypothetical protein